MKNNLTRRALWIACATAFAALSAFAQQHRWAGRTLDDFEWTIHERLIALPSYGVFDTINFEVHDKVVTLSGEVVGERLKHRAERAVKRVQGVKRVVNHIDVLPSSRQDDALRMNMYRALYGEQAAGKVGAHGGSLPIHIIVKNGWVTLEGVVHSDTDRDSFHLRALQVTAHVSDHLRVASDEYSATIAEAR